MKRPAESAVLFDLDGLLIDSEPLWKRAEERLLQRLGREYRHEVALEVMGLRMQDCAKAMLSAYSIDDVAPEEFARSLIDEFLGEVDGGLLPMPGAERALELASSQGPVAIASSSPMAVIDRAVATFGWEPWIDAGCSGDEVERGKPDPDIFLLAASRLGVEPARCTALEDSMNGARAAKAAGMRCVVVPGPHFDPTAFRDHADYLLGSLEELSVELIT